ncbi:MAG: bifunctional (p)ppGpp synthetase/guanosine-3',5'-bis(diphosphate) 3'-pyrophosphohydrolase [Planctomycetota bacterium]|nr:MAG: bifunctional (p)ppGpp synthetase/guanosine-3',5'-bis(diphosphate) 3'-pyrophosphohydrolase [Planctomycetota bacterium]
MTTQSPLWQRAASFAARAHQGQIRKDGKTPYVAHVYRVAMTVRDVFGCDDEIAICTALLHDTIEDTATDYDDIEHRFGRAVADCVAAMTKNMIMREDEREADYDARLAKAPWQARLVKLADVYDNGHDMTKTMRPARHIDRCERALELTKDDESMPCFVTARAAVSELLARLRERD